MSEHSSGGSGSSPQQHNIAPHCRICGGRLKKAKGRSTVYECALHSEKLLNVFGVDVTKDDTTIHPLQFCNGCYAVAKQATARGPTYRHTVVVYNWTPHTEEGCEIS